ncbi:MAG: GspH/FimT family protein [bacterium]
MIYYDLHYARMAAIKERSKLRVIFDNTNGHTYQIHHDLNFNGDTDDGENVITKDLNTLFRGIRFSSNRDVASFNPFGTSNGGTITVIEGSKIKKIIFSWVGMVRVNDPGSDE